MNKFMLTLFVLISQIIFSVTVNALDKEIIIENKINGLWKGEGKIIVSWSEKKYISFELQIDENGNVIGTIGDAIIDKGKIKHNNILYRFLGNREYVIDANLTNFLIEKEEIIRKSIRIFLDFEEPFLTGGFHTSGSKFRGKEKMIFSGTDIKLIKNISKK